MLLQLFILFNIHITNTEISKCAYKIYEKNYEQNVIILNHEPTEFKNTAITILNHEKKSRLQNTNLYNFYIINLETINNLKNIYEYLKKYAYLNPHAKYIIEYNKTENMEEIFDISWQFYIVDIIIIFNNELYTYFPFEYCTKTMKKHFLGTCNNDTINYFPNKVPDDMKGCEIRILAYVIPPYVINILAKKDVRKAGFEIMIINLVAERMNMNTTYLITSYPHWGYIMEDGTCIYMLKVLFEKKADVVFGMVIGNESFLSVFDTTLFHVTESIVWFVPSASQLANWKNLAMIFKWIVWVIILVLFLVSIFARLI